MLFRLFIFLTTSGINSWPPNPGKTLITRTKSIFSKYFFIVLICVSGFNETPTFFFKLFICFIEASIKHIKSLKKKVGVSLNPDTQINTIKKYLEKIDLVLVMSVFPGFGGQEFMPEVVKKIKSLNNIREKNKFNYSKSFLHRLHRS